jgi:hypothetical protein
MSAVTALFIFKAFLAPGRTPVRAATAQVISHLLVHPLTEQTGGRARATHGHGAMFTLTRQMSATPDSPSVLYQSAISPATC